MNSTRAFRFIAGLLTALGLAATGVAQTATLTASSSTYSANGGSITLTGEIVYPAGYNTVTGVTVTNGGTTAYTSAPSVVFSRGGGGTGATATASLNVSGGVGNIAVTNGGSGYTSAPTVIFSGGGGGSGVAATAVVSGGIVTAVNVTNAGSGYTTAPTIKFSGGAAATATINGSGVVTGITVTSAGANYEIVPTVTLTGGGGAGATASPVVPQPTALGFTINQPANWSVNSVGGPNIPSPAPAAGDTGTLGFAYSSFPANHASFTVTLDYPPGLVGNQTITASAQFRSPTTTLTVADIVLTPAPTPPAFTTQPTNQTVTSGQNATFTAAASGFPAPGIKWQKSSNGTTWTDLADGGRILGSATGTLTITGALSTDALSYRAVATNTVNSANSNAVTLTVNKASQTITFNALSGVTFGVSPITLGATASSGLAVSYASSNTAVATVSGNVVTVVGAGSTNITASQAGNSEFNAAANVVQALVVGQGSQTITFNSLATKTFGDSPFASGASASSGLAIALSSSDTTVATVSGGTITIVGAGTSVITANQAGNTNFAAAAAVQQTLTVNKANQTITFGALAQKAFNSAPFTLGATASSALAVSYSSSNTAVATVSGNTVTIVGTGTTTITASQAGNTNFNAATSVDQVLTVVNALQTITFAAIPARTFVPNDTFTLGATASSNLTVTYASSNTAVATVSGATVTIVGAGTTTITASQAGNANFGAATDVPQALVVNKATATVTLGSLTPTYDGTPKSATATTNPASLNVTFTYAGNSNPPTNAGTYAVVGTINDANYTGTANGSLVIGKAAQTITFGALSAVTFGGPNFDLGATTTSPLTVTYTSSNPAVATVSGKTVTIVGAGSTTLTAAQAGDTNYLAATSVPQTLVVNKAAASVTLGGLSAIYSGTAKSATAATTPTGLTVTFTYNGSSTAPTGAGSYTVIGTIVSNNYQGSATDTLVIAKADQTITFGTLPSKPLDSGNFNLTGTASSGLAITYATSNPSVGTVATVSGSTVTPVNTGTITITASQAGDSNYNAATSVAQVLTILNQSQTVTFDQTQLPAKTFGNTPFTISATSNRGLTVSFASSNPSVATVGSSTLATGVSSATVTVVGAGTANITASQPGDSNTAAATDVIRTLTVAKAAATVTLASLAQTYDGTPRVATATTTPSGLTVTFTYAGNSTAPTNAGTYAVVGTINDANYAGTANGSLVVSKASQTITFGALATKNVNSGSFTLGATASSGLTVSYTSSNTAVATVSGNTVTLVGAGTTTITARQVGDGNYLAATDVPQTLTVNAAPTAGQTISSRTLTQGTAAVAFTPLPVQGGTLPLNYTVNPAQPLPTGLSLDHVTGSISGTATVAGTFPVGIIATDFVGATVTLTLNLTVNPTPVATADIPSKVILQNVAIATPFKPVSVAGGTAPFTYAVSPNLATGLTFNTTTGMVSGTPTVATDVVTHTVTVTDFLGAQASATFTLKVNRAPVITAQPALNAQGFYLVNGTLTLSVTANGSPTPTYQWRKHGNAITGNASATTPTLVVPNLALTDADDYDVVVSNEVADVPSNKVTVLVYLPPAITTQPVSQTITAGGNATFSVVATGNPALTYEWRRGGVGVPGSNSSTYTFTNVPATPASTQISVKISNLGGFVISDSVTLAVNPVAPAFAPGQAITATAVQGRNFSFGVVINNTPATFSATGLTGPGGLAINADNGFISGIPANVGTYPIVITATNTSGHVDLTLTLTVAPPPPVITSAASTSGRVGTPFIFTVVATNSPTSITSTTLPAGLTLSGNVISGTPTVAGSTPVTLTVSNASGAVTQPFVITIDPPLNAPVYTGTSSPSGTQGTVFSFVPAFGAVTAPYVLTGTLPTGLNFNAATGEISGNPTQTGSFPVTVKATNAGGATTVPLTIVINPAPSAPVITSAGTTTGRVGTAFSFNLTSSGTPVASSYSATGLPAGLTFTPGTGAIGGSPTVFGTFAVQVRATNTVGTGPASVLQISIAPATNAPVITSTPVAPGQVGQPFTYNLTATNTPTSFAVTSGTLPAGLSLVGAQVVGTPLTAALGETRVWFNASNTFSGLSTEVVFNIAPAAATPEITSNGTAVAQVGQPFQYTISANSTTAITGFAASGQAGSLPTWLSLNASTGVLSGIPSEATTTPIMISLTAANSSGTGNPKTLSLSVAPAPATPIITSSLTKNGQVGTAFTYQMAASESPTSYVVTGLPPGLSLNSTTGAITGSPTAAGTFQVTLRAANASGIGAPAIMVVTIAPAVSAPGITSDATKNAQVGTAFSYQILASNGPIVSYGIVDATALPNGLSLNTATGLISGTPVGDPRFYTVYLTATNAGATSAPQALSINLLPALGVPELHTPLSISGQVGQDFSLNLATAASNITGSAPYAPPILFEAVDLPPGLGVNGALGVIQGKPTAVGEFDAIVMASNAAGTGPMRPLTITIDPAPSAPSIADSTAVGQVGQAFVYQITAVGSPTSFEVLGTPPWMNVNPITGTIGGSAPAPGTFTVQLVAKNSFGSSKPADLDITIQPAAGTPVVTSSRTWVGTVGTAMSITIDVSPGTPTPTFIATGLPAGLTLTGNVISGTPLISSGLLPFTVIVTPSNSNGIGAPAEFKLTIKPNVTFQ